MVADKFTHDLTKNSIPFTVNLDIIPFLVDIGTIGDWNMQVFRGHLEQYDIYQYALHRITASSSAANQSTSSVTYQVVQRCS
jgi:hypothetical protein